MNDIALKIENLTKEYRLGTIGHGTLREDMQSAWSRFRGKEDPNSLVTANHNIDSDIKHFLALDDVSFEIKKGDRVGVIGKNGAGKSTLLKILSRITSSTKGKVYINGRIGSLLEVGTGFHGELTGRQNIYLNGTIMGMKKCEIDEKFDQIVEFSGVEKFIDTPVKRYSSGMFVRLGFAVAAHLEPDILIVDEVLAVGDVEFQEKAIGKMRDVSNEYGRTVLFVSHNMDSIFKLCQRVIILEKGKIVFNGTTEEGIKKYLESNVVSEELIFKDYLEMGDLSINGFDYICINSYCIIDNEKKISNYLLFTGNKYKLQINIEVLVPHEDIRLGYGIYDVNNILVFNTSSADYKAINFDNISVGRKMIEIELPIEMLFEGEYYIELLSLIENKGWILMPNNETRIKFKVLFSGIDKNIPKQRLGETNSSIIKKLEWVLEEV